METGDQFNNCQPSRAAHLLCMAFSVALFQYIPATLHAGPCTDDPTYDITLLVKQNLIACLHRRHGQDKTVLSCPCQRSEHNCRQHKTLVLSVLAVWTQLQTRRNCLVLSVSALWTSCYSIHKIRSRPLSNVLLQTVSSERALNAVDRTSMTVIWQASCQCRHRVSMFYDKQNSWKLTEV